MSVKISENEPYIITLDSFDLKYIRTDLHCSMSGVAPIWSCVEKNYYEFLVVTDSESDDETDLNDVMKCQKCHLCDVEVPVIFLEEHYNSEKHKLYKKLTLSVMERAAKSIDTCHSVNKKNITQDIYYCAACSVAVLRDNKWVHEKSKQHLNSMKYDENMTSLIKLYNKEINIKTYNAVTKNDEIYSMNNTNERNVTKHVNSTVATPKVLEVFEVFEGGKEFIEVKPGDGVVFKVPKEHYHGLELGNTTFCKLCDCPLKESIYTHIESSKHIARCEKPVDKHCLREMDRNFTHCIACNILVPIEDTDQHINLDCTHKLLLNSLVSIRNMMKQAETYCKPCDRSIQTHNFLAHTKSKAHKSKTATNSEPPPVNDTNYVNELKINHITSGSNPKEMKCDICMKKIPNTSQNINEHVKTMKHKDNLLAWNLAHDKLETAKVELCGDNVIGHVGTPAVASSEDYCEVCKVKLPNTGKKTHEMGRKHKANMSKK